MLFVISFTIICIPHFLPFPSQLTEAFTAGGGFSFIYSSKSENVLEGGFPYGICTFTYKRGWWQIEFEPVYLTTRAIETRLNLIKFNFYL